MNIKRLIPILAACAAILFSSCAKEEILTEDYIKSNLYGKWRYAVANGEAIPTDRMKIGTYATESIYFSTWSQPPYWYNKFKWNYIVEGDKIGYMNPSDGDVYYETVISLDHNKMVTTDSYWKLHPEMVDSGVCEYLHITKEYSQVIVGLWEGVSMEGEETYGDEKHRFEYKEDGTYVYYNKNSDGEWIPSDNTSNQYVADGDFLAFKWTDKDNVDFREWWIIEKCNDNEMVWYALREREDGNRFETRMTMKRVTI